MFENTAYVATKIAREHSEYDCGFETTASVEEEV
jgi:hypothetical protein